MTSSLAAGHHPTGARHAGGPITGETGGPITVAKPGSSRSHARGERHSWPGPRDLGDASWVNKHAHRSQPPDEQACQIRDRRSCRCVHGQVLRVRAVPFRWAWSYAERTRSRCSSTRWAGCARRLWRIVDVTIVAVIAETVGHLPSGFCLPRQRCRGLAAAAGRRNPAFLQAAVLLVCLVQLGFSSHFTRRSSSCQPATPSPASVVSTPDPKNPTLGGHSAVTRVGGRG